MSVSQVQIDRAGSQRQLDDVYDDGFLRVEHKNFYIACGEISLKLPRKEFLLISRLAQSPNRIVTSHDLWTCAWGDGKT
jgi:two-component system alkaline phosphatase synthesis response regulator PhoP